MTNKQKIFSACFGLALLIATYAGVSIYQEKHRVPDCSGSGFSVISSSGLSPEANQVSDCQKQRTEKENMK